MRTTRLLWLIVIMLLVLWTAGIFLRVLRGTINLLLLVGLVILIYSLITSSRRG